MILDEGHLRFEFRAGVDVVKYDTWPPYTEWRPAGALGKAVDFVACDAPSTWLIEVKDFREQDASPNPANSSYLVKTVGQKIRDTLRGLAAIAQQGNGFAAQAAALPRKRVILHVEPPPHGASLFPTGKQLANILQRLRQEVRDIDSRPLLLRIGATPNPPVPWTVRREEPAAN